ncbi:hypothetical protein NSU_3614 [Novosphingobium pentaromativorans US6-1]|uniref:Uncharacterized protein n=1 Tax=Novosphingobium pentaromativorans US6-1 TaxID=1088721 RepID=G6EGZ3_9SPHN|nr:hypothetical protein NSU_3614 [Novosphingobium pentaromativorans US6-1]
MSAALKAGTRDRVAGFFIEWLVLPHPARRINPDPAKCHGRHFTRR